MAFMTNPTVEFLVAYLAVLQVGAIWLGLNPAYKRQELAHILADATPDLLLFHQELADSNVDELTAAVAETECEKPQRFDIFHGREVGLSEVVLSQHDVVELQVRRSQLQVDVPGALFLYVGNYRQAQRGSCSSGCIGSHRFGAVKTVGAVNP